MFINFRVYSYIGGSGAIMSTANDMAKYLLFLVRGGKNEKGEQVVEVSILRQAGEITRRIMNETQVVVNVTVIALGSLLTRKKRI